jgi:hypothetical protein
MVVLFFLFSNFGHPNLHHVELASENLTPFLLVNEELAPDCIG